MRSLVFLPLALLLGLVIGAWSPTEELRILRKENEELAKKQASNERNMRLGAFTRIVNIPDRASARQETRRTNRVEVAAHNQPDGAGRAAEGAAEGVAEEQEERRRMSPEDLRARIDEARELWETRVQIAREQWLNKLGLTADAALEFDAAIDAMNAELLASIQAVADLLAADQELTPELGVRLFSEMSAALARTYDHLEEVVAPEQRGELSTMELTDFIDPTVAEPMIGVQDRFEDMRQSRQSRRPRIFGRRQ